MARADRRDWLILAALFGGAAFVLALAAFTLTPASEDDLAPSRSSRSRNQEGTLVFFELLRRLGPQVSRLDAPLTAQRLSEVDALWVLDPRGTATTPEQKVLEAWVRDGGVLVQSGPSLLFPEPGEPSLTRSGGAPELKHLHAGPTASRGGPLSAHVNRVLFRDPQRFAPDELAPRFEAAFTDELGPSIITRRHGRGTIVYLASSRFLSSGSLGAEDNMLLAANLAHAATRHGHGARFAFDEWHQVPRATGGAAGLGLLARGLFTSPVGWTLLVLTGALALWMLREGTQLGTRMPVARPQRRSKLEYVIGVGGTWRARGARQLALELLLRNARHAFAARAHVGTATSISALAERLRQRTGAPLRGLEVTLESCQAALERPTLGAPEFRRLTAALTNLEAELVSASAKALARKRHAAEKTL